MEAAYEAPHRAPQKTILGGLVTFKNIQETASPFSLYTGIYNWS